MVISFQGGNYFKIQSGDFTVLVDPTDRRSIRGANVVLSTLKPAEIVPEGEVCFFIDNQGEYEIGELSVRGISIPGERSPVRTSYRLELEGIRLLVLGHLVKEPPAEVQENFHNVDVVIAPAGGKPYLAEASIAKLLRQIEPSVIIPALFKDLKGFVKEFSEGKCDLEDKIVLKAKDLKPGAMELRCLKQ
ncbi:MAG TPA: MBL fold metallo-hydrolase [Candidatus Paceibacterota bacterium]|nr:MBL fold metallo-hydrolase [Candidatus Paceibacterota bacterium]